MSFQPLTQAQIKKAKICLKIPVKNMFQISQPSREKRTSKDWKLDNCRGARGVSKCWCWPRENTDFLLGDEVLGQSKGSKGENAGRVTAKRKWRANCRHSRQAPTSARQPKTRLEGKGDHAAGENSTSCDGTVWNYFSLGLPQTGEKQRGCAPNAPNSPKAGLTPGTQPLTSNVYKVLPCLSFDPRLAVWSGILLF